VEKARLVELISLGPGGVRFAPSPTGRFHIGNLRTAWISREFARALGLPWVVRFEDIDVPRVLAGARESQAEDMAALGLVPDRVEIQSAFRARHWNVFSQAVRSGAVYPCDCSRKDVREAIQGSASAPHGVQPIYSGHCRARKGTSSGPDSVGWRFAVPEDKSGQSDFVVARTGSRLPAESTFVPAYHWACAIDDWDGKHALLVRAHDLAEVAGQHRSIMRWLAGSKGVATSSSSIFPAVFHTSLVTGDSGERLEKRTRGVTLPELVAAGWTAEALEKRFASSFDRSFLSPFAPGKIFGEAGIMLKFRELIGLK
jgi:glutamyl-tRNA synthetase